jgi:cell division protein FtsX
LLAVTVLVVALGVAVPPDAAGAEARPIQVSATALNPDVNVFMVVDAVPAQLDGVRKVVSHLGGVRRYALIDHADALSQYRRRFRNRPDLLRGVTAADLPESFEVETTHRNCASAEAVRAKVQNLAGVDTVAYPRTLNCSPTPQFSAARRKQCTPRDYNAEVFMQVTATPSEVQQVQTFIQHRRDIRLVRVVDPTHSLSIFRCMFAGNPDVLRSVTAAQLPLSFEVIAPSLADYRAFEAAVQALPGVDASS